MMGVEIWFIALFWAAGDAVEASSGSVLGVSSSGVTTASCLHKPPPVLHSFSFCAFIRLSLSATNAQILRLTSDQGTSFTIGTKVNGVYMNVYMETEKKQSVRPKASRQRRSIEPDDGFWNSTSEISYSRNHSSGVTSNDLDEYNNTRDSDDISTYGMSHSVTNFSTSNGIYHRSRINESIIIDYSVVILEEENSDLPGRILGNDSFSLGHDGGGDHFNRTVSDYEDQSYGDQTDEDDTSSNEFVSNGDNGRTSSSKMFFFEPVISPDVWHHLCLSYNHLTEQVKCHLDGKDEPLSLKRSVTNENPSADSNTLNYTDTSSFPVCLGSEEFIGEIAKMELFNSPYLSARKTDHYYPCAKTNTTEQASVLVLDNNWILFGDSKLSSFDLNELCDRKLLAMVLYGTGGYEKTEQHCMSLGGRLPAVKEVTDEIKEISQGENQACRQRNNFVSWLHTIDSFQKLAFHECFGLSLDGEVTNISCVRDLACSICLVSNVRVALYGHKGSYFDHIFHLRVNRGEAIWHGAQGSEIKLEDRSWVVSSPLHLARLYLSNRTLPIGRHFWSWDIADNSTGRLMAVSRCKTYEFSCNDGTCIDISERCDDVFNCKDLSDERNCNVVKLASSYNEFYEPPPRPGELVPTVLYYDVEVYHMGAVTTDEGKVRMDIAITVSWFDPRLDFTNLKLNKKNYFDCGQIWKPSIRVVTGQGDGSVVAAYFYEEQCYSVPKEQEPTRSWDDPWMSHFASGLTHPLEYHVGLLATVPCGFYLSRYPFDAQRCNVSFMVTNAPGTKVFARNNSSVEVHYLNKKRILLEYELVNLTTETSTSMQGIDNNTYFLVTFHLERLYGYHIMNSYFPSLLMAIISYSTFYFQIHDFYDRILVSLTSHFILASLFIAVTKSSTKTPYLKLIDVWYAAIMTYCFFVIIIQVAINVFMHSWNWSSLWSFLRKKKIQITSKSTKVTPLDDGLTVTHCMVQASLWTTEEPGVQDVSLEKGRMATTEEGVESDDGALDSDDVPMESNPTRNDSVGRLLDSDGKSCLRNRKIAGREAGSIIKRTNVSDITGPGERTEPQPLSWAECDQDIEIIVSDFEETQPRGSSLTVEPKPESRVRRLSRLPGFPVAKLLTAKTLANTTKAFSSQSAAQRNLNKLGPRAASAKCANLIAKIIMLATILGFLIAYFMTVQQYV